MSHHVDKPLRQPLKGIYIAWRLCSLTVLIPSWVTYYTIFPRPRASWTLKECVAIRVGRWLLPLNTICGIAPLAVDKTRPVPEEQLKETSFVWLEAADPSLIRGVAADEKVKPVRIPGYVWPKGAKLQDAEGLVGLWIHGGGYMMGNGSENFHESNVAKSLFKHTKINHILSVEYRVSGEAPHPAQLQDAIAAYSHLVNACGINPSRIIVFGACSGGHLALMLLRYLHDEKVLPAPVGLMLFSPWVDMAIDEEIANKTTEPRPNTSIDFVVPSFIANLRFLGHNPREFMSTPYGSANRAPPGSFEGYPRTFISIGDAEVFQRECEQLAVLMHNDGVNVMLDVQVDAGHDFFGTDVIPSDKARENALVAVKKWVDGFE